MKIAVLNRHFSPTGGGAERYSIALVEQLSSRHDIHVFAQHIDHQWPGVTYHKISQLVKRPRWFNQLWFATATWWATRRGFDVVHSHENTWHGQVQTVHVLPVKYNLFQGRTGWALALRWLKVLTSPRLLVYLWLERSRFSMTMPRTIVVTSNSLIVHTLQAYPECRFAIAVVTPGVDQVNGATSQQHQFAARQSLGLPAKGCCVLFVGNDYRKKGLITLIAAMPRLPVDSFLVVVGNTTSIADFKVLSDAAGLFGRIHFLGSRKDMDEVYSAADCLAHPTLEDTFAMVVLEAMAHGLPVVVSNEKYCGIAGLLTHETDALILAEPTDADGLAAALNRLMDEPAFCQRLIKAGLDFARQHLWATVAQQQESIYLASIKR
jgi:UDP-glucose:(heptosyl)LPS alpha-1,3-glucosyltransferase